MRESRDDKLATIQSLEFKLVESKRQLTSTPGKAVNYQVDTMIKLNGL
jgi:hypothetical protein